MEACYKDYPELPLVSPSTSTSMFFIPVVFSIPFFHFALFIASAYIISSSEDVLALKGSSVVFEVTASGIPDSITYQWKQEWCYYTFAEI